jgi:hypothetical protein
MRSLSWAIIGGGLVVAILLFSGSYLALDIRLGLTPGIFVTNLLMDAQKSDAYYLRFFGLVAAFTDFACYSAVVLGILLVTKRLFSRSTK